MPGNDDVLIISLSVWDRLGILAACAVFFLVVILIIVCSLTSFCPLFPFCPFNRKKVKGEGTRYGAVKQNSTRKKEVYVPAKNFQREVDSSDWSDSNLGEYIEISGQQVSYVKRSPTDSAMETERSLERRPSVKVGGLNTVLSYNKQERKFLVKVNRVSYLQPAETNASSVDCYVRMRLYRTQRSFLRRKRKLNEEHLLRNLELELQTKIQRKTGNPAFNETFEIIVDENSMKNYTVLFQLVDFDRFSRHIVTAEGTLSLQGVHLGNKRDHEFETELFEPSEKNLGSILISMSYLPTSEKLCLKIVKMTGLQIMDKERKSTDSFVRLYLMTDGRHMKKAKTAVRKNDLNPVFNETFVFDVPTDQLKHVYFIVSVLHREDLGKGGNLIGRVYLGDQFFPKASLHWQEVSKNARKEVGCWYKLQG